jgi:predicted DsbA family dithiol-disulfide isomerase
MKIKVFADTICGWCYIGHSRLNKALEEFKIERVNSYRQIANEKNITGVPFFEIGNDYISGAQSSTNLATAINV